jgi:hypothetical protein
VKLDSPIFWNPEIHGSGNTAPSMRSIKNTGTTRLEFIEFELKGHAVIPGEREPKAGAREERFNR